MSAGRISAAARAPRRAEPDGEAPAPAGLTPAAVHARSEEHPSEHHSPD